jgi:nucleolar protein 14
MHKKNKESTFVDRRFGENDPNMSIEDKMMARFIQEKSVSVLHCLLNARNEATRAACSTWRMIT